MPRPSKTATYIAILETYAERHGLTVKVGRRSPLRANLRNGRTVVCKVTVDPPRSGTIEMVGSHRSMEMWQGHQIDIASPWHDGPPKATTLTLEDWFRQAFS